MDMIGAQQILATIWFLIIGLFLAFYVVLDGFDLGVGILSLFANEGERRTFMMRSLGSVWDANETWLVVVGGTLFGAFPLVYGTVLQALYIPIILMLMGLVLRGVAFEFRELSPHKTLWGLAFGVGSLIAAITQGLALGAVLQGMAIIGKEYVGGTWDWLSPFSVLVAIGVVAGYTLLGATYSILKTTGPLQEPLFREARACAWFMLAIASLVTVWTPLKYQWAWDKWFNWPGALAYGILPFIALFAFWRLFAALSRKADGAPFLWTIVIFLASFAGLAATIFPYIIPNTLTIYQAASSAKTQIFMLAVVSFFIPIMIAYNAWLYFVFHGKINEEGQGLEH